MRNSLHPKIGGFRAPFVALSALACGILGWSGRAPAATYDVIDPPPGYLYVNPSTISQDGSKVAGSLESDTGSRVAFVWTATGGIQPILLSGYPQSTGFKSSDDFSVLIGIAYTPDVSSRGLVWSSADGARAIDPLTGDTSSTWEVFSADGSTVLGQSRMGPPSFTERAFFWTAATGTQEIASPGCPIAHFLSISDDGSSAVGYMSCGAGPWGVYWNSNTGTQYIPILPSGSTPSTLAYRISGDGSTVAYLGIGAGIWRIGLWTVGGDIREIDPPAAESNLQFTPSRISEDGSTVVFQSNEAGGHHVFRWSEGNGSQSLSVPGFFSTDVIGMSADGSTVILNTSNDCTLNCNQTAFVWTAGFGFQEIPPPAGQDSSNAGYVSADGTRVGGNFYGSTGDRGFVWAPGAGVETFEPVLGDVHSFVQTISADGTRVVGGSCTTDYGVCRAVVWPLSAPPGQNEVPTPASEDEVTVEPVVSLPGGGGQLPVQVTFDSVSSAGITTVTASNDPTSGISVSPPQFSVGDPPVYYDVDTTASFAGPIILCFSWQEGQFDNEGGIALFHFEGGAWQNVTTSVDINNNKVCGQVNSLSPFALFERTYAFSGFFQPVDNLPTRNTAKAGAAIPIKFSLSGNQGLTIFTAGYPASQAMTCDDSTASDVIEETLTASANGLTYDAASDQYTYVWKTSKGWSNTCRLLVLKLNDGARYTAEFGFK